jgi:fatty acid desaturase
MALTHVRSYAEHCAEAAPRLRTRVVETNALWSLLFLNNNLHIAHHAHPQLAWYRLPRTWRQMRGSVPEPGLIFAGYRQVMRRYLFRPYITAEHPFPRAVGE